VYDPFVKRKIVENQVMDFVDFINNINILVIITAHNHIKNKLDIIKSKIILDTKNICKDMNVYKL
jgi:UDP-N-acetyl-D-mannosaminuronic acid dehydrogenase